MTDKIYLFKDSSEALTEEEILCMAEVIIQRRVAGVSGTKSRFRNVHEEEILHNAMKILKSWTEPVEEKFSNT